MKKKTYVEKQAKKALEAIVAHDSRFADHGCSCNLVRLEALVKRAIHYGKRNAK